MLIISFGLVTVYPVGALLLLREMNTEIGVIALLLAALFGFSSGIFLLSMYFQNAGAIYLSAFW
jgi:hypothetical protein